MKKIIFVSLILITGKVFCQRENKDQVVEGIGTSEINLSLNKKAITNRLGKSNKCEGWIGKFSYNETTGEVKDERKKEHKLWKNLYCNDSLGVRILFKKNKIYSISFLNNRYITTKEISVGSSRKDVLNRYGGNYDSPKVSYYQLGVNFIFINDVVTEIEVVNMR